MPKFAAFLRAVNLGSNRRVSGAELRELFEGQGFAEVASFRTSGNVAFAAEPEPERALAARIEAALTDALGYDVPVFLRGEEEMRALAEHEPFERSLVERSKGKLQVMLLAESPGERAREEVLALATDADRLAFGTRELFWLPSGGTLDSQLDLKAIAGLLGSTTMRTKGTVDAMASKFFAG